MLIPFIQRLLSPAAQASTRRNASVPAQLMECADASAGQDPRHAAELRRAAIAYLGVVH
ncbi:MAG: hypothetical protein OZ923_06940 [Comamonadaceae bacterium]|nr:hypothetical protein [Burkholderiales bacterium]MEB2348333.1 hypothetical protein [Comamonadaceae bacterium]